MNAVSTLDPGRTGPSVGMSDVAAPDASVYVVAERRVEVGRNVAWYRYGRHDPTTQIGPASLVRAMRTISGAATLLLRWTTSPDHTAVTASAWGPGAHLAVAAGIAMSAVERPPAPEPTNGHPFVSEAHRRHPSLRAGASGDLYHELLPTILGQRITGGEAVAQWRRLAVTLGEAAPGPFPGLLLPPAPQRLAGLPTWAMHRLGIERSRAQALVEVARVAHHLPRWATLAPAEAAAQLVLVRGVGVWTIGTVLGPACGDDDAMIVGDYHLPNTVAWNLAGEARATDARMVELLAPYRGQRGRVVRLLGAVGRRAPAFGPRQRILPMARW